jgi:hypothetical protein
VVDGPVAAHGPSRSRRSSEVLERAVVVGHLGRDLGDHIPVLDDLAVVKAEQVVVRRRDVTERAFGHHQHEVALTDDLVDRVVADVVALGFELGECLPEGGEMMRVLSSDLGPATTARVEALGAHARVTYADWVERAKTRGEIASGVPTTVAAAFIDTQFTMLLVQMALGADPELLRAQAGLAFAGLTGAVIDPSSRA